MLFIVIHHCIVSGLDLNTIMNSGACNLSAKNGLLIFMNCIVIVGVNIFFLISGYFNINFRLKKLFCLVGEIIFYSGLIYLIGMLSGIVRFSLYEFVKYTLFAVNQYWFMLVYLVLMLLSPYINILLSELNKDKKRYSLFLAVFFFLCCLYGFIFESDVLGINSGYSLLFAIFLYCTGNYIKVFEKEKNEKTYYIFIYIISIILNYILIISLVYINKSVWGWKMFSYNNPLIYIEAIMLFMLFVKFYKQNKIAKVLSKISPYVLAVYLISSNEFLIPYRFAYLKEILEGSKLFIWPLAIIGASIVILVILAICVIIECIRKKLVSGLILIVRRRT